jgi:2-polyprenyl-3-methyl-5-hydroxy-6-metoxy-1,4-benzoquinol methylase
MPAEIMAAELHRGGEVSKVLDIAASHGLYGIAVAKQNPAAHVYAVDWKNVLQVAVKNARAAGITDRHHLLPGSAFEVDVGSGYDLALITNFLHHFDAPTCITLMQRVYASLKPNGRAAIVEFVPNPDRISPPTPAAFSMVMLVTTSAGDAYTFTELEDISQSAGFAQVELAPPQIGLDRLVIAYR